MNVTRTIVAVVVTLALASPVAAQKGEGIAGRMTEVVNRVGYELTITPPSDRVTEFTPINVTFKLKLTRIGIKGALRLEAPSFVEVCPALIRPETTCYRTAGKVVFDHEYGGIIRTMAPPAGQQSQLRVVVLVPASGPGADDAVKFVAHSVEAPMTVQAR